MRDLVATRAFDLGIAEAPFDRTDAIVHRYRFDCVAVLRVDHVLAGETHLTPALLDDHPLIGLLPSHGTTIPIARAFEAAGTRANIVAVCEFYATALNLVLHGVGVCISDPISAAQAIHGRSDLVIRSFTPTIPDEVGVLRPSRGGTSHLAERFIETLDDFVRPYLVTP